VNASILLPYSIPSPAEGVWHLGPVPLRGYALAIIVGIVVAIWIGERRWIARGGRAGEVSDLAVWMVPFGIVGARLYHVATDWELYFGPGRHPVDALKIWQGGLGIWGAIACGALGLVIGARVHGIKLLPLLDALAPGVLVGQAIGRWGNWFNQELYGGPTDLPWGLEIDPDHRPVEHLDQATFHPTFLYESLWSVGAFLLLLWADRKFRMGHGTVLAGYVMLYTAGRAWIENLRVDSVQLDDVGGLRFNVWTSLVLFVLAAIFLVLQRRRHPGRETHVRTRPATDDPAAELPGEAGEPPVTPDAGSGPTTGTGQVDRG